MGLDLENISSSAIMSKVDQVDLFTCEKSFLLFVLVVVGVVGV